MSTNGIKKWKTIEEIAAERKAKLAAEEAAKAAEQTVTSQTATAVAVKEAVETPAVKAVTEVVPWYLSDLLKWQFDHGFAFTVGMEYKEPPLITVDYDLQTDEWCFAFKRSKNFSVYDEFVYSIGRRLSAKWDKDIFGWRFPAVTYNMRDMMEFFERKQKELERWKGHKIVMGRTWSVAQNKTVEETKLTHNAELYEYFSRIGFTSLCKNMLELKTAQEERWVSLKALAENKFVIKDWGPDDKPLYTTQVNGIEFLDTHDAIIGDDMATGKTRILLNVLWNKFKNGDISRALVVCVVSGKDVWRVQSKRWFKGRIIPIVVTGSYDDRIRMLEAYRPAKRTDPETGEEFYPMPLYIISYASARAHPVELQTICDDGALVLDESHNVKAASSQQTQVLTNLRAKHKFPMSGSMVTNTPMDSFTQVNLVYPNLVGRSPYEFENYFSEPGPNGKRTWKRLDEFNARIKPWFIRRLKKEVLDLPGNIWLRDYEEIPLSVEQRQHYRKMALEFATSLKTMDDKEYRVSAANIMVRITRLLQICDGFLSDGADGPCEWIKDATKPKMIQEILENHLEEDNKIIIWSRFIQPLRMLETELAEYHPVTLHGQVPEKRRGSDSTSGLDTVIGRFHNDPKCRVFLGQIKSGGQSVDLAGAADKMIFYNQWWAPGDNEQAVGRAERPGQKNVLTIIPFVTAPTIEQYYMASEFIDTDGNEQIGILYQKKGWKDEAIDGNYDIRVTRQQLVDWLEKTA